MGVQEAVLSILVEQSDYGYRIARRLEDDWSSQAVYRALGRLRERGLIEPTDTGEGARGRPRKHYRATQQGVTLDAARLAEILRRLEFAPAKEALAVIDEYERQVLSHIRAEGPAGSSIGAELLRRERMFVAEARLRWIAVARGMICDGTSVA